MNWFFTNWRSCVSTGLIALLLALALPLSAGEAQQGAVPPRLPLPQGGDQNDWEAHFDRGVALFRESGAEAAAHFYWASRLDPSRAEPYFARWAIHFFRARNEDIYSYLRHDRDMLRRPDVVTADSLRALAMARNPFVHRGLEILIFDRLPGNFLDNRDTRAWLAYTRGQFPQAISAFTRSIDRGGAKAVWTRYDRSLAEVAAGDMRGALNDLTALLEHLRASDEAEMVGLYVSKHSILYMIGLIQSQLGNSTAAAESFGESVVEDASFGYGYAAMAALSHAARQYDQSALQYTQAIELVTDDGHLRYLYAQTLFDMRRYNAARDELERAILMEPYYAAPRFLLGRVYERLGDVPKALEYYAEYVRLAPARDARAGQLRTRLEMQPK